MGFCTLNIVTVTRHRFVSSSYMQEYSRLPLCSYVCCKYLWKGSEREGNMWQWKICWVGFVQAAVRKLQHTCTS